MNTIQILLEITFLIVLKMVHSTFVRHVHTRSLNAEQKVDRTKFKHKDVLFACLTYYKNVDDKEWFCKTCGGALASGKIPAC